MLTAVFLWLSGIDGGGLGEGGGDLGGELPLLQLLPWHTAHLPASSYLPQVNKQDYSDQQHKTNKKETEKKTAKSTTMPLPTSTPTWRLSPPSIHCRTLAASWRLLTTWAWGLPARWGLPACWSLCIHQGLPVCRGLPVGEPPLKSIVRVFLLLSVLQLFLHLPAGVTARFAEEVQGGCCASWACLLLLCLSPSGSGGWSVRAWRLIQLAARQQGCQKYGLNKVWGYLPVPPPPQPQATMAGTLIVNMTLPQHKFVSKEQHCKDRLQAWLFAYFVFSRISSLLLEEFVLTAVPSAVY